MTAASPVVLGMCAFTHDSAAALIAGGRLVGFCEEERLCGEKHTSAYPSRAASWLLNEAGLTSDQVDVVGYNFLPGRYLSALARTPGQLMRPATRRRALPRAASFVKVAARTYSRLRLIDRRFSAARVVPVLHHLTHGLYAFASAEYDDAAVLVVDSLGETLTTTIGRARRAGTNVDYRILAKCNDPASLGYLYGAVTEHLGWRRGDEEGTVMALAALGDPERFRDLFASAVRITDRGFVLDPSILPLRVLSKGYSRLSPAFVAATCPPRASAEPVEQVHADLAAALQERTEQVMLHLAAMARRLVGSSLLCLAGGVASNCVAVGKIVQAGMFDEVHVPPAPGDSGTAIGAAISCYQSITDDLPEGVTGECYLGPAWDDDRLASRLRASPGVHARRVNEPERFLAEQLASGAIVGLFRGRLEAGPRALGNRSILASPLLADVVQRLNATVKYREPFRPFAPVVLATHANDYFTMGQSAPFMSIASQVTPLTRDRIASIVHINGTARVQTVSPAQNLFLATVLAEFAKLTGVPILINTSLNVKGKPIAGTPTMAIETLTGSGLDALLIGDWWVTT